MVIGRDTRPGRVAKLGNWLAKWESGGYFSPLPAWLRRFIVVLFRTARRISKCAKHLIRSTSGSRACSAASEQAHRTSSASPVIDKGGQTHEDRRHRRHRPDRLE